MVGTYQVPVTMSIRQDGRAALVIVFFGLVVLWPVLGAHFVLVDDHEILSLTASVGAPPDARPELDLPGMAFQSDPSVGRFRPLYWTIRFGEITLLGNDSRAWHAVVVGLGLVSSLALYSAARALGGSRQEATLLGCWLLVAPGVSSLWVRLGADDTVATFFFTLCLLCAALALRAGRWSAIWDGLFVLFAVASLLSKEAFALACIAAGAARAVGPLLLSRPFKPSQTISGSVVACLGVAGTLYVALVGAAAGPLSYGGRYLALPDPLGYLRVVVQNGAILVYVGLLWLAPLVAWGFRRARPARRTVLGAVLVSGLALLLIGPQVVLYSQQGIFEGKYQDAAALGVAVWTMAGLAWLRSHGQIRPYVIGLRLWLVTVLAFGFSTWTYARSFTEDSAQLDRMLDQIASTTPEGAVVGIAADAARQYEPIHALTVHLAHRDRTDLKVSVLPLPPDRPYSPLEASFANALATSSLVQPRLSAVPCGDLGPVIVLGDETVTHAAVPCLGDGFQRVEFSTTVLLWGGDGVSLRPRAPGQAQVGYVALFPQRASSERSE
jgi:hypothetical protein